jgi:hypothetical protein
MGNQLKAGQAFPALRARTIHDRELAIPDPGRWVHLQFRRFAGCPVCNLHLQAFHYGDELSNLNVRSGSRTRKCGRFVRIACMSAVSHSANLRGPRRPSFDGDLHQGTTNRPTPVATINLGGAPNTIRFRSFPDGAVKIGNFADVEKDAAGHADNAAFAR